MSKHEFGKKDFIIKVLLMSWPYLLFLFFSFTFLLRSDLSFDGDLGRHLRLGEIIWNTHQVPKTNLFSYTNSAFPFINHHWFFEVLVYLASISIGLQATLVIKIIILLLCICIVLLLAKRTKSVLFIPVVFIFIHLMRERVDLRPEIISFLFTAITLYILDRFEKTTSKLLYLLPVVSLLWVNTHIYFPVGIFLQLIFLVDLGFKKFFLKNLSTEKTQQLKTLVFITGFSLILTLVNPNGIKGALYPFTVFSNYGVTITENQTIFTLVGIGYKNQDFLFYYLSAFLVLASVYLALFKKPNLKTILLSLLGLALATQSVRGFPYLFLISLPSVLENFEHYIKAAFYDYIKVLNAILVTLVVLEAVYYLSGSYYPLTYQPYTSSLVLTEDAKPALDFLIRHNLPQPIFNNFDIGSYIIYRTYPKYKVFIDGRPEAYPASFFQDTYLPMQENYSLFKKEEKKYGFQTVIFSITDQNPRTITFMGAITKDPEWKIVFVDQYMIIVVKQPVQEKLHLKVIHLTNLKSSDYYYTNCVAYTNLSTLLFNVKLFEQAKRFDNKALSMCPYNPAANNIMANIILREGASLNAVIEQNKKGNSGVFW